MSGYAKGRRFEYRVRDAFRQNGYVVIRAAQSKPIDLVCLKGGKSVLVECKTEKSFLGRRKRDELVSLAATAGTKLLVAMRKKRKLVFKEIPTGSPITLRELQQ